LLKIDLLPSYVRERRKVKPAIILVVVIILIEVALLMGASMKVKGAIAATQKELDEIEPVAKQVESLEAEAQGDLATVKPAIDRVKYYEDMAKLGDEFIKLIDTVNEYVYEKVTVQNFQTDGSNVSFTAVTDSTESFGRFLLNFLRCPAVTNVSVNTNIGGGGGGGAAMPGVPGIPGGGPGMPPGIGGPGVGAAAPAAGGGAELIRSRYRHSEAPHLLLHQAGWAWAPCRVRREWFQVFQVVLYLAPVHHCLLAPAARARDWAVLQRDQRCLRRVDRPQ